MHSLVGDAAETIDHSAAAPLVPGVKLPVRLAIVGCGAMVRENLLPVLAGHDRVRLVALVDVNEAAARSLADAYGVPVVLTSTSALDRDMVDAVIVATPPALHAEQTVELARRGLHVFVEKPMAIAAGDAARMVAVARDAGVTLAVGLYRRLLPSTRLLSGLIRSGIVGEPVAVDVEEGGEYGWPLATLANLTPRLGGGGVLIDIGSHLLDVVQFLLPGPVQLHSYSDNARGGVETDALLKLRLFGGAREIPCRLELSRTRQLRNSIRVECERGTLELPRGAFADVQVHVHPRDVDDSLAGTRPVRVTARWGDEEPPIGYQVFRAEIDDWLDAITRGREPVLSGASGVATVRLIEEAYATRSWLLEPWTDEGLAAAPRLRRRSGAPRRVLLTGASGFIGCRAAEILSLRERCEVRAIVRSPSNAARLARLDVEMVPGDICSPEDVARAIEGCDTVVHCAVGNSWQRAETVRTTVDGTRTVAQAALRAGVERFVHISSMAVHGRVAAETLDETTPLVDPRDDSYAGDKRRAEDEVQRLIQQGLRAVILRPARVYGPFGKTFVTRPIQHLARGGLTLAGPFDGPASMVYVDNVVEAILNALAADDGVLGEAFEISDPDQLSWREFYEGFAKALGVPLKVTDNVASDVPAAGEAGMFARWRRGLGEIATSPELRAFARRCIETDPIGRLPRRLWEMPALRRRIQRALGMTDAIVYRPDPAAGDPVLVFRTESARVVADKASRTLGYRPAVPPGRAMQLTLEWIRHSRIA
jgi:predicted dehydrogenase/nucleoside-diphosphate-sugar epimerase